ncbi:WD40 repeat domain-containing protein [Sphingomonas sp. ZT3P38]|uniref:WD40 repeat domain-containing protein n=1 Tax=Parasphingomonas zepuensis TaxID=3096161 RepID=UPI002FCBAB73
MLKTLDPVAAPIEVDRFTRHRGPVTSVAAIPGRAAAVAAAYDGAVALFDLESGTVDLLGYHRHLANHVTVNAAGSMAASSSSDYDIHLWDLAAGQRQGILRGHSDDVECFAFVDDRTGVSASRDRRIIVWDLATGAIRRAIEGHDKDVLSVTCHDGLIYSSGDDMTLRQWDLATGALLRTWGPFETETDSCAIDTLNHRVVLGCDDGVIRIFDSRDGTALAAIAAHGSGIKKVAVSPVNGDILSCAYDQRITVWDAWTFSPRVDLENHAAKWERSFGWSPDGSSILAGTFDGTVVQWDSASGRIVREIGGDPGDQGNACFNDAAATTDGSVALVADDGMVRLIRLTEGEARLTARTAPPGGRRLMNAVTRDPASDRVIAGSHDHKLHIFAGAGLESVAELALGQGPINSIRVATCPGHAGALFAACYSGAIVRVSPDGHEVRAHALHDGAVKALRLHPSEPLGVSCSADGGLLSWTLDGTLLQHFPGHTAIVDDVDLSPAGDRIASASRDFTLNVYDVADARLVRSIELGRRSPKSLCFWDADTVIVGDYWGALLKADLRTGRITRRTIAANGISSLSRSGAGLVASSYDGGVYLVSVDDLSVRNVYRAMVQRVDAPFPHSASA